MTATEALKEAVFIPDFSFAHPDGRRALMEIGGILDPRLSPPKTVEN